MLAVGMASADTIITSTEDQQTASGALPALSNPGTTGGTASVSQFNVTAANAFIQSTCPAGFICSGPTLVQINLDVTGSSTGSLNINNTTGATADIGCLNGSASGCTAVEGTLSLNVIDPLSLNIGPQGVPTFTVKENAGGPVTYFLAVANGTTPESGSAPLSVLENDIYSTSSGNWSTVMADYIGSGSVNFNLGITGGYLAGNTPTGVGYSNATVNLTSGSIAVAYDYTFTETPINGTPEPATMLLFGSALVGLGCIRKRVSKS